jgi:hypothetical protein
VFLFPFRAVVNFAGKFTLALTRRFALIEAIDAIYYCFWLARERYIQSLPQQINCASRDKNKNTEIITTTRKRFIDEEEKKKRDKNRNNPKNRPRSYLSSDPTCPH